LKLLFPELYLPFAFLSYASDLIFGDHWILNNKNREKIEKLKYAEAVEKYGEDFFIGGA
jgi:hypothetical protein